MVIFCYFALLFYLWAHCNNDLSKICLWFIMLSELWLHFVNGNIWLMPIKKHLYKRELPITIMPFYWLGKSDRVDRVGPRPGPWIYDPSDNYQTVYLWPWHKKVTDIMVTVLYSPYLCINMIFITWLNAYR